MWTKPRTFCKQCKYTYDAYVSIFKEHILITEVWWVHFWIFWYFFGIGLGKLSETNASWRASLLCWYLQILLYSCQRSKGREEGLPTTNFRLHRPEPVPLSLCNPIRFITFLLHYICWYSLRFGIISRTLNLHYWIPPSFENSVFDTSTSPSINSYT